MPLETLNCPNCGAPLPDPGGRMMVMCSHCHTVVRIATTPPPVAPAGLAPDPRPDEERPYTPSEPIPAHISARLVELLKAGRRTEAVEFYMSAASVSEENARDVIDAVQAGLPPTAVPTGQVDLDRIKHLLMNRRRTYAIQLYREQAGVSLSDAAKAIDAIADGREPPPIVPAGSPRRLSAADLATVRSLLERKNKVEAIKLYRERTGLGLSDAKLAIEAIAGGGEPPEVAMARVVHKVPASVDLAHIQGLLRQKKKMEAIKAYRAAAGLGLKEAQDAVEAIAASTPGVDPSLAQASAASGCTTMLALIAALMVCILGGCGALAQTTSTYRCAVDEVRRASVTRDVLGDDPNAGYLVLSMGYGQSFDFDGSWRRSMDLFMPAWGSRGLGLLYLEAVADDTGYMAMRATLFKDFRRHVVSTWGTVECTQR